jgi:ribosomal protein S18 acetylase RimI-like enzyme
MRFLEDVASGRGEAAILIEVRDSLPGNVGLYQSLGYELVNIDPHPRGPDRVWSMRKHVGRDDA